MSKRHRRDSGEDLWAWAERRNETLSARVQETPCDDAEPMAAHARQPGSFAKVLSALGLKSSGRVSLTR